MLLRTTLNLFLKSIRAYSDYDSHHSDSVKTQLDFDLYLTEI